MSKIRILPDRVANQIAAGEVIERPASIVKELVENSVDAGATRIEVEFRHGGRSYIRVEDNGSGMGKDDALLSIERHATSKIREAADLDSVMSFGFRGEALPSIASVSRFLLQTRTKDQDHGTEILVNGGKLVHVRDCGMPVGTRIVISHLFNSVPARRKFLKSDATESAHIVQTCRLRALASPQVAFQLLEDGRTLFKSPICSDLRERVSEIFGRQIADQLLPVEASEGRLRLSGLVGKPGLSRSTRHEMITFVNQRPVDNRTLGYGLIESYHTLIPKGKYPVAFLFLEIEPARIDVNVHPAKREIRFRDEAQVRGFTIRTLMARLRESTDTPGEPAGNSQAPVRPTPAADARPRQTPDERPKNPVIQRSESVSSERRVPAPPAAEKNRPSGEAAPNQPEPPNQPVRRPEPPPVRSDAAAPARPMRAKVAGIGEGWRYLGGISGGYYLFEADSGLVVMDSRAAQERIWFERFGQYLSDGEAPSQKLLLPVPLELDPIAAAMLMDHQDFLNRHGFEIALFGRNFFRIEAIPDWLEPGEGESALRDILGLIRQGRHGDGENAVAREEMARLAAGRVARSRRVQSEAEVRGVLQHLFACPHPTTGPDGRPTLVEITRGELARKFQKGNLGVRPDLA